MIKKSLAIAVGLASTQLAIAQGFYVDEQSALRLGDAFSGGAAQADDASTAFYNPAGLIRLKQKQATINLSSIAISSEFSGDSTTLGGAPVNGEKASSDTFDLLPAIYFSVPMSEDLVFGAYLNAPYATGADLAIIAPPVTLLPKAKSPVLILVRLWLLKRRIIYRLVLA